MTFRCIAAMLVLALALPAAAADRKKLAVLDVSAKGNVDPKAVEGLSTLFAGEASRRDALVVTSPAEIRTLVGFERQKELLGCADASCMAEIGGALGVDFVLASEVTKFGTRWLLSFSVIDIRAARTLSRASREATNEERLVDEGRAGVREVLAVLLPPEAPPAAVVVAPERDEPASWPRWLGVGLGAAAIVGGGVLYAGALDEAKEPQLQADADRIRRNAGLGLGLAGAGLLVAVGSFLFLAPEGASEAP